MTRAYWRRKEEVINVNQTVKNANDWSWFCRCAVVNLTAATGLIWKKGRYNAVCF
jgi:hypothetical protein